MSLVSLYLNVCMICDGELDQQMFFSSAEAFLLAALLELFFSEIKTLQLRV